jgi:hypothetical protein
MHPHPIRKLSVTILEPTKRKQRQFYTPELITNCEVVFRKRIGIRTGLNPDSTGPVNYYSESGSRKPKLVPHTPPPPKKGPSKKIFSVTSHTRTNFPKICQEKISMSPLVFSSRQQLLIYWFPKNIFSLIEFISNYRK